MDFLLHTRMNLLEYDIIRMCSLHLLSQLRSRPIALIGIVTDEI